MPNYASQEFRDVIISCNTISGCRRQSTGQHVRSVHSCELATPSDSLDRLWPQLCITKPKVQGDVAEASLQVTKSASPLPAAVWQIIFLEVRWKVLHEKLRQLAKR